ncbi:MAG: sugar-transfer associated ATP-grasp domain-containing protein [Eubacteriales bacterium]|nr:sugar-transfer associated ATP-grasp domain-containing protein [Eubacteriales bacterium]
MKLKVKWLYQNNMKLAMLAAMIKYVLILFNKKKKEKIRKDIYNYRDGISGRDYSRLLKDILFCQIYYKVTVAEYFYFGFEYLSDTGRQEYISDSEVLQICDAITRPEISINFRDKYKAYQKFSPYYGRAIIKVEDSTDDEIATFIRNHRHFLIKPLDQSKGRGIQKINLDFDTQNILEIVERVKDAGHCILEEEIVQSGLLNDFHPISVNTVRFATYITQDDIVTNMYAMIRIGCGNSSVDNISSGGIFANIDMETGTISSPAFDLHERKYLNHPDTHVPILGQVLPEWEELKQIAAKAARVIPQQKYVGWDFAYSNKGWIIVEANHRPGMRGLQVLSGHGLRQMIDCTIKQELLK